MSFDRVFQLKTRFELTGKDLPHFLRCTSKSSFFDEWVMVVKTSQDLFIDYEDLCREIREVRKCKTPESDATVKDALLSIRCLREKVLKEARPLLQLASRDSTSVFNAVYCYTSFYNVVVYLHHSLEEKELVDLENSNDAQEAKSAFEKADELLITEVQESTDADWVKLLVLYNKAFSLHMVQKMTTEAMDTLAEVMSILYPNTDGVIIEEPPSVGPELRKYITNLEKDCLETLVCRRRREIEDSENGMALSLINPWVINPLDHQNRREIEVSENCIASSFYNPLVYDFPVVQKSALTERNFNNLTILNNFSVPAFGWFFRLSNLYSSSKEKRD